jgi:hypothetical protein
MFVVNTSGFYYPALYDVTMGATENELTHLAAASASKLIGRQWFLAGSSAPAFQNRS